MQKPAFSPQMAADFTGCVFKNPARHVLQETQPLTKLHFYKNEP